MWTMKVNDLLKYSIDVKKNTNASWAAYFASNEKQIKKEIVTSQILSVSFEEAATPSIVKHCLTVILRAHDC